MKRIEYADLTALGADTMTLDYYSGSDFIKSIWKDGAKFILNSIDGKTVYNDADELLSDLKAVAIEERKIIEGDEALKMKDICTINLNEGEGRQTISWNEEDKLLYTSADNSHVDGYRYNTLEEAVNACYAMWGCNGMIFDSWELDWIEE